MPPTSSIHPRPGEPRPHRTALAFVAAAIVALGGLGARPAPVAGVDGGALTDLTPLADFTFYGRGYGH
ncbi:MAG: hypothetical protein QOI09_133, partial [Chloroflexota bacterium]|nr:hypothetical protein [Chloroflexota bacterium]